MRVLVACEYSGKVREEFKRKGHDAWSCDLLPTDIPGQHIQGDVIEQLNDSWDLMIAHPPCTYLTYAANGHIDDPGRKERLYEAYAFFLQLYNAPIKKICVENPLGYVQTLFRPADQIVHPYYFGEPQCKRTCLWLKNLPRLVWLKENDLFGYATRIKKPDPLYTDKNGQKYYFTYTTRTGHLRSKTFSVIAEAMAMQWG